MKRFSLAVLFTSVFFLGSCTRRAAPLILEGPVEQATSEIPERRDFPVNPSVQPCDDFYEYACSVPLSKFKLREDRSRHMLAINDSMERLLTHKKNYLAKLIHSENLAPRTAQLKNYYLACMNLSARKSEEKERVESLQAKLAAITDRPAFLSFFGERAADSDGSFVSIGDLAGLEDPSQYDYLPYLDVMSLPSKEYYKDRAVMSEYTVLVTAFFQAVGISDPAAAASSVVAFEKDFAELFPEKPEIRKLLSDKAYYVSTEELLTRYPALGLEKLLARIPKGIRARNILPKAFGYVNEVMERSSIDNLKNIFLYYAVSGSMKEAYPDFFAKKRAFEIKNAGGAPELPPQDEQCTQTVMERFEKELDVELINVLFPNFPKDRFEKLTNRVREAIVRRVEANTWLTPEGKAGALKKMRAARMQLVSPNSEEEWAFIDTADYDPKTPLANSQLRTRKALEKMLKDFGGIRDWRVWTMGPLDVNAYYSPPDNKFVMLQGILQYPLFDPKLSDAEILGGIGVVIGHELGHGIDNNGANFDENGVVRAWLPEADREEFKRRTALMIEQFDALVKPEINKNYGALTLGENIADTSGLRFAYEAAFPANAGSLDEKRAFYLQYARLWCGKMRDSEFERRLRTDYHAQTMFRVNEPLKHQPRFMEAYGCKAGDKMYRPPEKQMDLW